MKLWSMALAGVVLLPFSAAEAVTFTQSRAAFDAATGGVTFGATDTFAGATTAPGPTLDRTGYDITITQSGAGLATVPRDFGVATVDAVCGESRPCLTFSTFFEQQIRIDFDAPVNAVGFFLRLASFRADEDFDVTAGGMTLDFDSSVPTDPGETIETFVGIYDLATPFSSITLGTSDSADSIVFNIDDVFFGAETSDVAPVPLPPAALLLLAALGGLGWARRLPAAG